VFRFPKENASLVFPEVDCAVLIMKAEQYMTPLRYTSALILVACLFAGMPLNAQQASGGATPVEVHLIPFSHLDFFWGGTREECLARGNQIIAKAVLLAREYPEFRFLLEDDNFVANYVESHKDSPELADLRRFVKEGRIEIAPKWAAIFQNIPNGEVHVRNFQIGKRYARRVFGVDPQVAHLGDLPGYTPQFAQIGAKSGVPFMVMTRMGPIDKPFFRWRAPDGSGVLIWNTLNHYSWASELNLHRDMTAADHTKMRLEVTRAHAMREGPIYMNWGSDLWAPTGKLVENITAVNRENSSIRLRFSTPTEFFRSAARNGDVPDVSGEIPSSWPNVMSSLPHLWSLASPATNTLLNAEKFAAINYALGYAEYPQEELEFLWRKLVESMDHNHDGQGGQTGDDRKMQYSQLAMTRGGEILRDMVRNIAERVEFAHPRSHPIVVFNPLSWKRDDVVNAHVTLYGPIAPGQVDDYRRGMQLVDEKGEPVAFEVNEYSENISRALQITFIARDVPPLGYRTYYLVPAEQPRQFAPAATVTLDDEQDRKEPRRPMGADTMENEFYRVSVDKPTGRVTIFDKDLGRDVVHDAEIVAVEERGGNYIGIEPLSGRTIFNSVDHISLEKNNAVRTVLVISGRTADMSVEQRYVLYRGLKRVDVENTVQWTGGRFVRIQQLFPHGDPKARVFYGVPFGAQASDDLMPGTGPHVADEIKRESWLQSRQVLDWISASSAGSGLTIGSSHQLYKLDPGVIRAEMLRGARFTSVKVVRGDEVTSLFYPPPGRYGFHFTISSAPGDWKTARAYQTGMNSTNPLIPVSVVDEVSHKSLPSKRSFLSVEAANLVVSSVKKAEADDSILVRVYEIEGRAAQTSVEFLGRRQKIRETNLLEEDVNGPEDLVVAVAPYEIKTVRLSPAGSERRIVRPRRQSLLPKVKAASK
jgi:alpha-mannosidase